MLHRDHLPDLGGSMIETKHDSPSIIELESLSDIKTDLDCIQQNTDKIQGLTDRYRLSVDDQTNQTITNEITVLSDGVKKIGAGVKQKITNIQLHVDQDTPFKRKALDNLHDMYFSKFKKVIEEFSISVSQFQSVRKDKMTRYLSTTNPDLKQQDIEYIIENDLAQVTVQNNILGHVVVDMEQRYTKIVQLEKSIADIHEMMKDLSMLIDQQQESLNIIELRVQKSLNHTKDGKDQLVIGNKYSKKLHQRTICICCMVMAILLVILIPILVSVKVI